MITAESIERICSARFSAGTTPRSQQYKEGFRHAIVQRALGEKPMCIYLPGSVEFDAYWAGRDAGDGHWKLMTLAD